MKFLCLACDDVMAFAERQVPGDGTMAAVFACPSCGREVAMLTNPMETQLVSSLGVKVGGRTVPEQPMELVRTSLDDARADAFDEGGADPGRDPSTAPVSQDPSSASVSDRPPDPPVAARPPRPARVTWSESAVERLGRVPSFVRGMVKRIYVDWARENGVAEITPEVMDRARSELGLEGM